MARQVPAAGAVAHGREGHGGAGLAPGLPGFQDHRAGGGDQFPRQVGAVNRQALQQLQGSGGRVGQPPMAGGDHAPSHGQGAAKDPGDSQAL